MPTTVTHAAASRDRAGARRTRTRILASSKRFWRASELPLPASTAQHLLGTLVERGELRRVRRDLYWRGLKTPLGMSPPPVDALVAQLADTAGAGPAGLSAAHLLRLSTQVPRQAEIAVPGRAPAAAAPVKFVSRAARTGRRTARLSATEVAVLEALGAWENVVEVSPAQAWTQLSRLVREGAVRPDRLARAARTEPATVRARLKRLLEDVGHGPLAARVPAADARVAAKALRASVSAGNSR